MIWLIIAILVALTIGVLTEKGEFGWTLTCLALFIAVYYLFTKDMTFKGFTTYVTDNVVKFICFTFVYIVVGIVWSLLKWREYCVKIYSRHRNNTTDIYLSVSHNKARITAWMMWWPLSLTWWLAHQPITRLYNYIYSRMTHLFESIRVSALEHATKKKTE